MSVSYTHLVLNPRSIIIYAVKRNCTVLWNCLEKGSIFDDALDDKEYEGNLIYLLKSGSEFIRNNSKVRFVKEAQYRVDTVSYTHLDVYKRQLFLPYLNYDYCIKEVLREPYRIAYR